MIALFNVLLSFLFTPIGVLVALIGAVLIGKFLWSFVIHIAEAVLVAAILFVVFVGLGGFDRREHAGPAMFDQAPAPVTHRVVRMRRI